MAQNIYLDYAASTPLKKEVLEEMLPYMTEHYGNASSIHGFGRKMHQGLEQSRRTLAKLINASADEFYFVSSGTEADNWALKGIAEKYEDKGKHIIVSSFEHPAVLNTAKKLAEQGYEVTFIAPEANGIIEPEKVIEAMREDTILVSIMFVNNELGTIQPIEKIGAACRERAILCHTDAVQAFGYLPVDVKELQVDLMSISSHKIYGPLGIGGLYIRKGIKIKSLLDGGAQERKRRASTSNVPAAVGFAKAASMRYSHFEDQITALRQKRTYLLEGLKALGGITENGLAEHPGTMNLYFQGISGETLLMNLDLKGIAVSSGSACSSGSVNPSHVLLAIGMTKEQVKSSIRLSVGDLTSYEQLDVVIDTFKEIINRLR